MPEPTLRMAAPKRTVAGAPVTAWGSGRFHVAALAPRADSRSPNQFLPDRMRFTSWSSRTPKATCCVRTSSTSPAQGSATDTLSKVKDAGASKRKNHLAVSPHKGASWTHPSSKLQCHVSCVQACQHNSSPGSNDPSSSPRNMIRCWGKSKGRSTSLWSGKCLPPRPNNRRALGSNDSGSSPASSNSS